MKQIFIIHGGDSFNSHEDYLNNLKSTEIDYERLKPSKKWRDSVASAFSKDDVLTPTMPNSANAQFDEWKIWFEKMIPFFEENTCLVGHSLGAMFLTKYLHKNPLKQPVNKLVLLAGGYDDPTQDYGSFKIDSAKGLEKSAKNIYIMHSRDDFVVPFSELAKYKADLPSAKIYEFEDRNHFLDADFPELIEILK